MLTKQFNTYLSENQVRAVKSDAAIVGVTISRYVSAALSMFQGLGREAKQAALAPKKQGTR